MSSQRVDEIEKRFVIRLGDAEKQIILSSQRTDGVEQRGADAILAVRNDLESRLENRLDSRIDSSLDSKLENRLNSRHQILTSEIQTFRLEQENRHSDLRNQLATEITSKANTLELGVSNRIDQFKASYDAALQQKVMLQLNNHDFTTVINGAQQNVNAQIRMSTDPLNNDIQLLRGRMLTAENTLTGVSQMIQTQVQSALSSVQAALETKIQSALAVKFQAALDTKIQEIAAPLKSRIQDLEAKETGTGNLINDLIARVQKLEGHVGLEGCNISSNTVAVSNLKQAMQGTTTKLTSLEASSSALQLESTKAQNGLLKLETDLTTTRSTITSAQSEITGLHAKVGDAEVKLASLRTDLDTHQATATLSNNGPTDHEKIRGVFLTLAQDIEVKVQETNMRVVSVKDDLEKEIKEVKAKVSHMKQKRAEDKETTKKAFLAVQDRLKPPVDVKQLASDVQGTVQSIAGLKKQLAITDTEVNRVDQDVQTRLGNPVALDVNQLSLEIKGAVTKVTGLQTKLTSVEAEVSKVKQDTQIVAKTQVDIQAKVDTIETSGQNLQTAQKKMGEKLTELQNTVDDIDIQCIPANDQASTQNQGEPGPSTKRVAFKSSRFTFLNRGKKPGGPSEPGKGDPGSSCCDDENRPCHCHHLDELIQRVDEQDSLIAVNHRDVIERNGNLKGQLDAAKDLLKEELDKASSRVERIENANQAILSDITDLQTNRPSQAAHVPHFGILGMLNEETEEGSSVGGNKMMFRSSDELIDADPLHVADKCHIEEQHQEAVDDKDTKEANKIKRIRKLYDSITTFGEKYTPTRGNGGNSITLASNSEKTVDDNLPLSWPHQTTTLFAIQRRLVESVSGDEDLTVILGDENLASLDVKAPTQEDRSGSPMILFMTNRDKRFNYIAGRGFKVQAIDKLFEGNKSAEAADAARTALKETVGIKRYLVFEIEYLWGCGGTYAKLVAEYQRQRDIKLDTSFFNPAATGFLWYNEQRRIQENLIAIGYHEVNPKITVNVGKNIVAGFPGYTMEKIITCFERELKLSHTDLRIEHVMQYWLALAQQSLKLGEEYFYRKRKMITPPPSGQGKGNGYNSLLNGNSSTFDMDANPSHHNYNDLNKGTKKGKGKASQESPDAMSAAAKGNAHSTKGDAPGAQAVKYTCAESDPEHATKLHMLATVTLAGCVGASNLPLSSHCLYPKCK